MMSGTSKIPIPRLDNCGLNNETANTSKRRPNGSKLTRRSDRKVRSGCITCKIRRIKCDEAHPSCKRCIDTGRKCDGYIQQTAGGQQSCPEPSLVQPQLFPSTDEYVSDERRSLARFRCKTAHELSRINNEYFWHVVTPKAAQYEPAIYHGIVALGALHELLNDGKLDVLRQTFDTCTKEAFALKHYNKAIQHVIKPVTSERIAPDVCIIACLLFANIEALRGQPGSAMSHVQSGVRILEQAATLDRRRQLSDQHTSIDSLSSLVGRLDFASVSMTGRSPMNLSPDDSDSSVSNESGTPAAFTSIEEASQTLHYHLNALFHGQIEVENACKAGRDIVCPSRDYFVDMFADWNAAFDAFIAQNEFSKAQTKDIKTLQLINAYFHPAVYCTAEPIPVIQPKFDDHLPFCRRVIELAQEILSLDDAGTGVVREPTMTFGTQIVGPLYGLAQNCHDPNLRRQAVRLMQMAQRREGIWDSTVAAIVAMKVIDIEECGLGNVRCAEDVPRWARIDDVHIEFDDEGRIAGMRYTRGAKEANGEIIRREFFEKMT